MWCETGHWAHLASTHLTIRQQLCESFTLDVVWMSVESRNQCCAAILHLLARQPLLGDRVPNLAFHNVGYQRRSCAVGKTGILPNRFGASGIENPLTCQGRAAAW